MANETTALAKINRLKDFLNQEKFRNQVALALPKHLTPERFIRVALTTIIRNPLLAECTLESIISCLLASAQLGLETDGYLGQAYLVPFKNNKKGGIYECQLIPGYRGYISLAKRTGDVQSVAVQDVYEKDQFELEYGLNEKLRHIPAEGDRGEFRGAYVVVTYMNGGKSFDYMDKTKVDSIRERSKAKDNGPWVTDYGEMGKKSVIRRHFKVVGMSSEFAKATALEDRSLAGETQQDLLEESIVDAPALQAPPESPGPGVADAFDKLIPADLDKGKLAEFVKACAKHYKKTEDEIKANALKDSGKFFTGAKAWIEKREKAKGKKAEPPKPDPKMIACPQNGEAVPEEKCGPCNLKDDCPQWAKEPGSDG